MNPPRVPKTDDILRYLMDAVQFLEERVDWLENKVIDADIARAEDERRQL